MSSNDLQNNGCNCHNNGLCAARAALVDAMNEGGCSAKQLSSLLEVLSDHLDQASERWDPLRAAELAADVARIAQDWSTTMSGRMFNAEERCCATIGARIASA